MKNFNENELRTLQYSLQTTMEVLRKEIKALDEKMAVQRLDGGYNKDVMKSEIKEFETKKRIYSKMHNIRWSIKATFDEELIKLLEKEL